MKKIISLFAFIILSITGAKAQIIESKITTSGQCEHCKETIEKNIRFEKGVKKVAFDEKTHVVTVKYDETKTNLKDIQIAISKLGYDADSISADPKAYEKLNACCKKKK
jgi:copper chaperone CopZ